MRKPDTSLILCVLSLFLLLSLTGCAGLSHESFALEENWGISLPEAGVCSEEYETDSGSSFHGDGLRYHVYTCQNADAIRSLLSWSAEEQETIFASSCQEAAQGWLTELSVPERYLPDYSHCVHWYESQPDHSELLILWDSHTERLYILESFL